MERLGDGGWPTTSAAAAAAALQLHAVETH